MPSASIQQLNSKPHDSYMDTGELWKRFETLTEQERKSKESSEWVNVSDYYACFPSENMSEWEEHYIDCEKAFLGDWETLSSDSSSERQNEVPRYGIAISEDNRLDHTGQQRANLVEFAISLNAELAFTESLPRSEGAYTNPQVLDLQEVPELQCPDSQVDQVTVSHGKTSRVHADPKQSNHGLENFFQLDRQDGMFACELRAQSEKPVIANPSHLFHSVEDSLVWPSEIPQLESFFTGTQHLLKSNVESKRAISEAGSDVTSSSELKTICLANSEEVDLVHSQEESQTPVAVSMAGLVENLKLNGDLSANGTVNSAVHSSTADEGDSSTSNEGAIESNLCICNITENVPVVTSSSTFFDDLVAQAVEEESPSQKNLPLKEEEKVTKETKSCLSGENDTVKDKVQKVTEEESCAAMPKAEISEIIADTDTGTHFQACGNEVKDWAPNLRRTVHRIRWLKCCGIFELLFPDEQ